MTILAAIDVTKDAEPILTTAHELATAFDDPLAVVYVMSEDAYESRRRDITQRDEEAEYPISHAEDEAAHDIEAILEEVFPPADERSVDVTAMGRVGAPVTEVLEAAREEDARYLVVGGHKRTPTGKALFGSTTQSLLLNADRPVVTVMRA